MPNRIIKESARTSVTLYRLSHGAERLFWRLIVTADDFGRFEADPEVLRSTCFPRWPAAKMPTRRVLAFYQELAVAELVRTYVVSGAHFGEFVTWAKHQQQRATKSKYPDPTPENTLPPPSASNGNQPQSKVPVFEIEFVENIIRDRESGATTGATTLPAIAFEVPKPILSALNRAPVLGAVRQLREPAWWQAQLRANPGVDFSAEVLKAEAWMRSNPSKAPKSNFVRFLHSWLRRADREEP